MLSTIGALILFFLLILPRIYGHFRAGGSPTAESQLTARVVQKKFSQVLRLSGTTQAQEPCQVVILRAASCAARRITIEAPARTLRLRRFGAETAPPEHDNLGEKGRLRLGFRAENLLVAETTHQMIVHQSGGLHQRVTNRWPHKSKAALLQIRA